MASKAADIEAEIRFLTTAEGGRTSPVWSGYRAAHDFCVDGTLNDAFHEYDHEGPIQLGETVKARLWFAIPDFQTGRLYEGFTFTIHEGMRIVGRGRVTRLLNATLRKLPE
jgi:elongation factor Tu